MDANAFIYREQLTREKSNRNEKQITVNLCMINMLLMMTMIKLARTRREQKQAMMMLMMTMMPLDRSHNDDNCRMAGR